MKIIDKTPFRKEDGSISFIDRIQGTLKYGLPWYGRLQAQEKIIPVLEKHLGRNFILMRNIILGGTDIELPIILIGPPAVLVINVITEQGVFRAQEDEWGKIVGNQFVPAKVNHLARTVRMGKVLQVFLERAGAKGITVDTLLLSANPGTHVESIRPVVRVVMSDAMERFAASLSQAKAVLGPEACAGIAQLVLSGKPGGQSPEMAEETGSQPESLAEPNANQFFFHEENPKTDNSRGDTVSRDGEAGSAPEARAESKGKPARKKKTRIMGLTLKQIGILAGILLAWLCLVIVFFAFVSAQLNV
ncbi:MAG: hypothetical protein R6W69_08560 [Anaerolineales bacterium]